MHATHDAIERMVVTEGHKILRAMLQQHYDLRASMERDVAVKAHDRHRRERLFSSAQAMVHETAMLFITHDLSHVRSRHHVMPSDMLAFDISTGV